ncbi:MAG: nuclear transport factor 2 family protein, partial [Saprospiraceae bacterium]|nr:nuclear transport factor 2 family protein [Saprospiraceae bacterium]
DAELFNALHTDDILRVSSMTGILVGEAYKNTMQRMLTGMKEGGQQMLIDFRFEQRADQGDVAYEVGYYKITWSKGDDTSEFFGRFHVVLRKVDGTWKIAQDWDSSNVLGLDIGQTQFDLGKTMDESLD